MDTNQFLTGLKQAQPTSPNLTNALTLTLDLATTLREKVIGSTPPRNDQALPANNRVNTHIDTVAEINGILQEVVEGLSGL